MQDVDYLLDILSRNNLNLMSGKHKQAYKICLCAIFLNTITGRHYTYVQEVAIKKAADIAQYPRKLLNTEQLLKELSDIVNRSMRNMHFKIVLSEKTVNEIIVFFRKRLHELKEEKISLFPAKELDAFVDMKKFFSSASISNHHWIQFSLLGRLTISVPECFIFNDLKVQWNLYIDTRFELKQQSGKIDSSKDKFNFHKDPLSRSKLYTLSAIYRILIILSVSFVESYLYNLFYCIKHDNSLNKEDIADILCTKKVEDTQIVELVLFKIFPNIKNNLTNIYSHYKTINKYRNRYIHASSFLDPSNGKSELQPLLELSDDKLVDSLQTALDFVNEIDKQLPENLKLLFWKYEENIQFNNFEKIPLFNSESSIDKINYYGV